MSRSSHVFSGESNFLSTRTNRLLINWWVSSRSVGVFSRTRTNPSFSCSCFPFTYVDIPDSSVYHHTYLELLLTLLLGGCMVCLLSRCFHQIFFFQLLPFTPTFSSFDSRYSTGLLAYCSLQGTYGWMDIHMWEIGFPINEHLEKIFCIIAHHLKSYNPIVVYLFFKVIIY